MYQEQIDMTRIPEHVAIIMDGNGRWARERGMERTKGHVVGAKLVRQIVEDAVALGIKYLTLYTFSTENWKRPQAEISTLMELLFEHLKLQEEVFMKNGVRFHVIGDIQALPILVRNRVQKLIEKTAANTRSNLVLALSYSSRWEITEAARKLAAEAAEGRIKPSEITEETISARLATNFMPDPDLIIRTGGEFRLSNYLMWQASYSELYFTDVFWPDFNKEELCKAIYSFQQRERRFGLTSAQVAEGNEK